MTIKHATHPVDVDRPGSDSSRLFHEGKAERVVVVAPTLRAVFERTPDDTDPITLAKRYLDGADIVIVEGFKSAPIPKIEVLPPRVVRLAALQLRGAERGGLGCRGDRRREVRGSVLPRPSLPGHHVAAIAGEHRLGEGETDLTGWVTGHLSNDPPRSRINPSIHRRQPALRVPLDNALDAVLAEDIESPIHIPPWGNSAMDGYAVRSEDVRGATSSSPRRLRVIDRFPPDFPSPRLNRELVPGYSPGRRFRTGQTRSFARKTPISERTRSRSLKRPMPA